MPPTVEIASEQTSRALAVAEQRNALAIDVGPRPQEVHARRDVARDQGGDSSKRRWIPPKPRLS